MVNDVEVFFILASTVEKKNDIIQTIFQKNKNLRTGATTLINQRQSEKNTFLKQVQFQLLTAILYGIQPEKKIPLYSQLTVGERNFFHLTFSYHSCNAPYKSVEKRLFFLCLYIYSKSSQRNHTQFRGQEKSLPKKESTTGFVINDVRFLALYC